MKKHNSLLVGIQLAILEVYSNSKLWFLDRSISPLLLFPALLQPSDMVKMSGLVWHAWRTCCFITRYHLPLFFPQLLTLVTVSMALWRKRNLGEVKSLHIQKNIKVSAREPHDGQHGNVPRRNTNFFLFYYNNFTPMPASENLPLVEVDACVSITDGESSWCRQTWKLVYNFVGLYNKFLKPQLRNQTGQKHPGLKKRMLFVFIDISTDSWWTKKVKIHIKECVINSIQNIFYYHLGFSEIQLWLCTEHTCIIFHFLTLFDPILIHFHSTCYSYNLFWE